MLQVAMMSLVCSQDTRRSVRVAWLVLRHAASLALQAIAEARQRAAEQQELRALDARLRRDIGLGPCEVHQLARKSLWHA